MAILDLNKTLWNSNQSPKRVYTHFPRYPLIFRKFLMTIYKQAIQKCFDSNINIYSMWYTDQISFARNIDNMDFFWQRYFFSVCFCIQNPDDIRLTTMHRITCYKLLLFPFNLTIGIFECVSDPCQNGAQCIDFVNGYLCMCTAGWTGTFCNEGEYRVQESWTWVLCNEVRLGVHFQTGA